MIEFTLEPAQVIGLLLTAVFPLLVGLVTQRITSPGVKATLLAGLSLITGLLTELLAAVNANAAYDLGSGLLTGLIGFLLAVGLHFGLYKPTGAAGALQDVGAKHAR